LSNDELAETLVGDNPETDGPSKLKVAVGSFLCGLTTCSKRAKSH